MKSLRLLSALVLIAALAAASAAVQQAPPREEKGGPDLAAVAAQTASRYAAPKSEPPDAATHKTIEERTQKLGQVIGQLRSHGVRDPILADVQVYHKAARWIVRFNEFYRKTYPQWTVEALDRGLLRAGQAARGESPWLLETGHPVVRGYRSRIDGSVQPYAVTLPADYGKDTSKKWGLDVVLHGRNAVLTEVSFLHDHNGDRPAPRKEPARDSADKKDKEKERPAARGREFIRIDVYGRGNNGYRWAGETDVGEALENFLTVERALGRGGLLDVRRTVLRGFSMGGAGTWHIGLHRPDQWSVLGPGAGFVTTHGYVKGLPQKLPEYQEKCLRIYDAVDYAQNAADVAVVAYAGADDPQLQAAKTMEAKLKPLGIPMTLLVAPGLGHKFPPEWEKKAEAEYAKYLAKDRPEYPEHVHFVTYTVKYPVCNWVEIMALDHQYERALVDAKRDGDEGFTVKTENVHALHLGLWPGATRESLVLNIDGQRLEATPYMENTPARGLHFYLERNGGKWSVALPERLFTRRLRNPQKTTGMQGPIDDTFMRAFLCVRGTRRGWNEATERYAEANLERFQDEWARYFRGELPVKDDTEVTPEDIASHHLVLFGDPSSNSLIEQALPGLPLTWTKDRIAWDGKTYSAADHVPVMVYPSPLTTNRYVVLNTGHTFHARDFQGTNALLFPRLGDYAVLKLTPGKKDPLAAEVITAGLFDIHWRTAR